MSRRGRRLLYCTGRSMTLVCDRRKQRVEGGSNRSHSSMGLLRKGEGRECEKRAAWLNQK